MDDLFKEHSNETFTKELEDVLNNLYDSDTATNILLKEDLRNLILTTKFNINEITSLLNSKDYDETKVKSFVSLLNEKKNELLAFTLIHHNCSYGEALSDFDWKLKLVCGTSQMKTMAYFPLLQLVLHTVTSEHKQAKTLYEMNKDNIARLIEVLKEALEKE